MIDTTVLILAAGQLPDRQLGPAPLLHPHPLDLPAGSDFALQRIVSHYREKQPEAQLVAVINQQDQNHYQCLKTLVDLCLAIPSQASVGDSLKTALSHLQSQLVIVNPITSLTCIECIDSTTIVIGEELLQRQNWSAFTNQNPNNRNELLSKLDQSYQDEPTSFPFTGLLAANRLVLMEVLKQLSPDQKRDLGWVAALLLEQESTKVLRAPWYDLGHRATYARSRRSQLISRSHNRVDYNEIGDLIQKRSSNKHRLSGEANYIQSLPLRLKRHFPALIDYSDSKGLELEYIPFPSLTELFLHWEIGIDGWRSIWQRLGFILNEFKMQENPIRQNCNWLYSQKLEKRYAQLRQGPGNIERNKFWSSPLVINGRVLPAPNQCVELVKKALIGLEKECSLQRIHGDLCFNNILADPLHASLRLIDPRGETAEDQTIPVGYGDPRYDLIKLLHSGYYCYDLVIHELYELSRKEDLNWTAKLIPPRQSYIVAKQLQLFVRERGLSLEEERWLTASLFFSMLPLHGDNPSRQRMLCLIGCCIAQDCFSILLP